MSDTLTDAPPVTDTQDQSHREEWIIAWVTILLLVNGNATRPLFVAKRKRARDLLRVGFEGSALTWAQRVIAGHVTPQAWQVGVGAMIADYARQMAVAGAGTLPNATVQALAAQEIAKQEPYLDRFGGLVAAGALSVAAIAARTRMYGGSGWGMYWMGQGSNAERGIVEVWISRDDRNTCSVCAPRNGKFYLPGQGDFPGTDCLGGGLCRCERQAIYDPQKYAQLGGR